MAGVSPRTAIIVFVFIFIISLYIALRSNPVTFDDSRVRVFLVALVSLAIVMTVLFYYGTLEVQQVQQRAAVLSQTTVLSDDVLNAVLVQIVTATPIIPEFAMSLLPLDQYCIATGVTGNNVRDRVRKGIATLGKSKEKIVAKTCARKAAQRRINDNQCVLTQRQSTDSNNLRADPCTPEAISERVTLATRIFTLWQQVIEYGDLIDVEPVAYVYNFLQRANSYQLYQVWQTSKYGYNRKTQQFGDLLFCVGLNIEEQTPEAYRCAAIKLLESQECKDLHVHL